MDSIVYFNLPRETLKEIRKPSVPNRIWWFAVDPRCPGAFIAFHKDNLQYRYSLVYMMHVYAMYIHFSCVYMSVDVCICACVLLIHAHFFPSPLFC
jgi:hypothetical protein